MADLASIVRKLEGCVANQDIEASKPLLAQVKLAFLQGGNNAVAAVKGLECGVLLSIVEGDLEAFGRFLALLLPYYGTNSDATANRHLVLGLHLMHLLVEHRLSEFHSVLELLDEREVSSIPVLSYPVGLERQLQVGFYDEIMSTPVPHPSYQFFVDNYLEQTVRDNIADGMEVSYEKLSLDEAASRMKFNNVQELESYVQEYRPDWIVSEEQVDGGMMSQQIISFVPVDNQAVSSQDIGAPDWISQSLQYATEMERIV